MKKLVFIVLITLLQSVQGVLDEIPLLLATMTKKEQELFLNNGLARGILEAPRDRQTRLKYEWACYFKILSEFTTRQYTGFTIIDPLFLVPTQPRPTRGGDAQAAPILDSVYLASAMDFRTSGLCIGGFEVSSFIRGKFGNLIYVGSLFSLWDASVTLEKNDLRITLGQKEHPLSILLVEPDLVALNWGAPITPNLSVTPQVRVRKKINERIDLLASLYSSYFINDAGPYGFLPDYTRWSAAPAVAGVVNYAYGPSRCGMGLSYKLIRPRLVTNNNFISDFSSTSAVTFLNPPVHNPDYVGTRRELIGNSIFTAYNDWVSDCYENKTQLLVGGNGMELFNFGGYGVTDYNQRKVVTDTDAQVYNFERSYTVIPYLSVFNDFTLRLNNNKIQPGIFVGYTQPLQTHTPLARNPDTGRYSVYTIDLVFQRIQEITNPKPLYEKIFRFLRVAPRVWVPLSPFLKIGAECNIVTAWYGLPNEYYKPLSTKPTTMIRATLCTLIGF